MESIPGEWDGIDGSSSCTPKGFEMTKIEIAAGKFIGRDFV
jgi:hypothetical protein